MTAAGDPAAADDGNPAAADDGDPVAVVAVAVVVVAGKEAEEKRPQTGEKDPGRSGQSGPQQHPDQMKQRVLDE